MIHEQYILYIQDWSKWRYAYLGGSPFIDKYLYKYNDLEDAADYALRKKLSYSPSFAKAAINEIRNSIYERMTGVSRESSNKSYVSSAEGFKGGVDNRNSTMNYFIGTKALPELLVLGKVIICVDMPDFEEGNLAETYMYKPYLYIYCREQLLDWSYDEYFNLTKVKLEDNYYDNEGKTQTRERLYELIDGRVRLTIQKEEVRWINIPKIPIVIAEISNSLMEDIADYQIALLNLSSSDMNYIHTANFPFYVEQTLGFEQFSFNKSESPGENGPEKDESRRIKIGAKKGRSIPKGVDFPEFIHPSPEPLKASMEKQEQIKKEIRGLISLTLSNLTTARTSADSKQEDRSREETGLSYIGLELEAAENQILQIWNLYQNNLKDTGRVIYPVHYNLKSTEEILNEGNKLLEHAKQIASETYRKEIAKKVAKSVFESTLPSETLEKIYKEIDSTGVVLSDPAILNKDLEDGIVSKEYASRLRGYPEGEVEVANKEHAERAEMIAAAQSRQANDNPAARGVPDLAVDPKHESKMEKKDALGNKLPVRGEGK